MHRTIALLLCASAVAACATAASSRPSPMLHLQAGGVSPPEPDVDAGGILRVVNDDVRAHEIYSSDCHELATTPLQPGQTYLAQLEPGPKICHFQDLLSPTEEEYWGTVRVGPPTVTDPLLGL